MTGLGLTEPSPATQRVNGANGHPPQGVSTAAPFVTASATSHNPFWLGYRLVDLKRITKTQLDSAIAEFKRRPNTPFAQTLERLSLASQKVIGQLTAEHHHLPYTEIPPGQIPSPLIQRIPLSRARNYLVTPYREDAGTLTIAVADPDRYTAEEARHDFPNRLCNFVVAPRNDILSAVEAAHSIRLNSTTPADAWLDILNDGVARRASDIHIEQLPDDVRVRFRIDGYMVHRYLLGRSMKAAIVQAVKMFSGLDPSQKQLPQDGQGRHVVGATNWNCRINTFPVIAGENVNVRLQDESRNFGSLVDFGLSESQIALCLTQLAVPDGLFYVTGPTGSGKTTLQYALLGTQALSDQKVITIEDPIEYTMPDYSQTATDDRIGRTFAIMLRAALRQDPDVILIGETRDSETANVSANAALTGHRVFSTLHTRNAPGAINRLLELGVEPFVLTSAVRAVIATRLVQKLCTCRRVIPDPAKLEYLRSTYGSGDYFEPVGCEQCQNSGYRGMTAITEIYPLNDPSTHALILKKVTHDELTRHLTALGFPSMRDDGLEKCRQGITTVQEVISQV